MFSSYNKFLNNFMNFSGTASRSDFWWPMLANYLLAFIILFVASFIFNPSDSNYYSQMTTLSTILGVIVWFGTLSLQFRRLHDSDHSSGWILIQMVPIIGTICYFILLILPTTKNRWS